MSKKEANRKYSENKSVLTKLRRSMSTEINSCICPSDAKPLTGVTVTEKCRKIDIGYVVEKLGDLVSDPATNDDVPRICRFLSDYLCAIGDEGYQLKHLPAVIKLLEFLAGKASEVKDYQTYLNRMLELCERPPLLDKNSRILVSFDALRQYFTLLGYLMAILPTEREVLQIHRALHRLLIRTKPVNVAAVKLQHCRTAMEESRLPITLTELLAASFTDMYPMMLELVFLLASVSSVCCYKMLEAGILSTLLVRMDLPYATQLRCTRPPDLALDGKEHSEHTMLLIMNILWSLMRPILPGRKSPDKPKDLRAPAQCALWGLRYAFKRQIRNAQHRNGSLKTRNDIAMFILFGLAVLPSWNINFISSGVAEDVIVLLAAMETGEISVWAETVKLSNSNENLLFEKTLLLIASHLAQFNACHSIITEHKLMRTVLQLVNLNIGECKITWSAPQFWNLFEYAMYTLAVLASRLPEEFLKYDGTTRLLMMIEQSLMTEFNLDLITNYTKTICTVVISENPILLGDFRERGLTCSLIKLVDRILEIEKLTTHLQRLLTLLLISIEGLMRKQLPLQEMNGDESIKMTMTLLYRCLYQREDEFQVDQRLLLAVGSYIWECIVWCPSNIQDFIECGAVYMILDILEFSSYYVRCLYLAILTDICDDTFCGPYLCTWRTADKERGLMSLLAMIWREEEVRLGVKRNEDGCIEDVELPHMGTKQWMATYRTKLTADSSPAINDMIGSVRSKIYSIRKIIERDKDRYDIARDNYKILLNELPVEDQITMSSVDFYFRFKLGQVWTEIRNYLDQVGLKPLSMDGQVIFLMIQRHHGWAMFIKERQMKLALELKNAEKIKEKDEFARIRDSKLAPSLDALEEMEFILRTTDKSYLLEKKEEQRRQVDEALNFPSDADEKHCHRTFQNKIDVTAIFDLHQIIKSVQANNADSEGTEVPLVSTTDSNVSGETSSLLDCNAPLSYDDLFKNDDLLRHATLKLL